MNISGKRLIWNEVYRVIMQIPRKRRKYNYFILSFIIILEAELQQPEELPNRASYSYGKEKEPQSWFSNGYHG